MNFDRRKAGIVKFVLRDYILAYGVPRGAEVLDIQHFVNEGGRSEP